MQFCLLTLKLAFFHAGKEYIREITPLCQIFVYANSATNPLIYSACNSQFREGFKNYFQAWLSCFLGKCGKRKNTATQNGGNKLSRNRAMCHWVESSRSADEDLTLDTPQESVFLCNNGGNKPLANYRDTAITTANGAEKKEPLTKV